MFVSIYNSHPLFNDILKNIREHNHQELLIKNLIGSSFSCFIWDVFNVLQQNLILVMPDKEQALYTYTDFVNLNSSSESPVIYFPSSYKRKLKNQHFDNTQVILRNEALHKIHHILPHILVTYPEALSEKL